MNSLHKTARLVVIVVLLLPFLSPVHRGAAQAPEPPYRLTDMVPVTDGSQILYPTSLNGTVFFLATNSSRNSLWKSDGTPGGTQEVLHDQSEWYSAGFYPYQDHLYFMAPGGFARISVEPEVIETVLPDGQVELESIASMDGSLYFLATMYHPGSDSLFVLYKSDGSAAGTQAVRSWLNPDPSWPFGSPLAALGDRLFFNCPEGSGSELCASDGTPEGTGVLKKLNEPGRTSAYSFTVWKNKLFFATQTTAAGYELWVTDGLPENTQMLTDLVPGPDSSYPGNLTAAGDWLYFTAYAITPGYNTKDSGLWKTDGTAAGTSRVQTAPGGYLTGSMTPLGALGSLLFIKVGNTLWRTDGTQTGTFSLNGAADPYISDDKTAVFGGRLYYHGCEPTRFTHLLMSTDGTISGTTVVKAVTPGLMSAAESRLVFAGDDGYAGQELWSTDGTGAGTYLVKDINTATPTRQPAAIIPAGKRVFMISDDTRYNPNDPYYNNNPYYRLWISDGTPQGTRLAPNPAVCHEAYYVPHFYTVVGDALYYPGGDCDLWRTDGTENGTYAVQKSGYDQIFRLSSVNAVVGERLYVFVGGNSASSYQDLGVIEGSPAEMRIVKSVSNVEEYAFAQSAVAYQGQVYFITFTNDDRTPNSPRYRWKLWKSDGTTAGTQVIATDGTNEDLSWAAREPSRLVIANNLIYFAAGNAQGAMALYQSNGTAAGTRMVAGQPGGGKIRPLASAGGYLYVEHFVITYDPASGFYGEKTGLYKTNGMLGLQLVSQLPDLLEASDWGIREAVGASSQLFFSFNGRLWITNGTTAGTRQVVAPDGGGIWPGNMTALGGRVFFSGSSGQFNWELWMSDGTSAGTIQVADLWPGGSETSSSPSNLMPLDGRLFFSANDGQHGYQLWVYDFMMQRLYLPLAVR